MRSVNDEELGSEPQRVLLLRPLGKRCWLVSWHSFLVECYFYLMSKVPLGKELQGGDCGDNSGARSRREFPGANKNVSPAYGELYVPDGRGNPKRRNRGGPVS